MFTNRGAMFVLAEDGSLWFGYFGGEKQQVAKNTAFRSIDAGYEKQLHSLVVDSKGEVWTAAWNSTNTSSLIKLNGLSNIVKAVARPINSGLALDTSGRVWSWGGMNINFGKDTPLNASPKVLPVQHELTVTWNGTNLPLESAPIMREGSLLVPMRELFEVFGAKVDYSNGRITATRGERVIQLTVYSKTAVMNGKPTLMSTAPTYVNGKTYVPLRFLSQSLGATVGWDAVQGDASIVLQ